MEEEKKKDVSFVAISTWIDDEQPYITVESSISKDIRAVQLAMIFAEIEKLRQEILDLYLDCPPLIRSYEDEKD